MFAGFFAKFVLKREKKNLFLSFQVLISSLNAYVAVVVSCNGASLCTTFSTGRAKFN